MSPQPVGVEPFVLMALNNAAERRQTPQGRRRSAARAEAIEKRRPRIRPEANPIIRSAGGKESRPPGVANNMSDWNQAIIDEFRANTGRVGGYFEGRTLLLLHHRGAKTGVERVNPLAYQRLNDDSVAVFASKGGDPKNPDWYYNLVANPDAEVEIGTDRFPVRARVAEGDERDRIFEKQKADWDGFAEYEEKLEGIRVIPVLVLEAV